MRRKLAETIPFTDEPPAAHIKVVNVKFMNSRQLEFMKSQLKFLRTLLVYYHHILKRCSTSLSRLVSFQMSLKWAKLFLSLNEQKVGSSVRSDILSTDAKTHFIKLDFINKGTDAVNLPSILRSKSVMETVSTYFKEKEPPIISYTYTKTIATKIFNFSSTLSDLDYHQFHNNPSQCECNTSSHLYQPYGHVITLVTFLSFQISN